MSSTLVLDATTKTISVVLAAAKTTTDPTYSVHYGDATSTAFVEGAVDGVLNGTTPVTVLASPAASTRRIVKELTIYNADTVAITANISLLNSSGSTSRIIFSVPIAVGATYKLSDGAASSGGTAGDMTTALTHAATSKTPPIDADELPLLDSVTSFSLKKLTWANLKATIKAYTDTLYNAIVTPGTAGNVMTSTGSAWSSAALPVREKLSANRTYYVRTDGNDSNTGLADTSGGAFLTIQKAVSVVSSLDFGIYDATIQIADGTYSENVTFKNIVGGGTLYIKGNLTTPTNVIIAGTGGSTLFLKLIRGTFDFSGFKITNSGGIGIYAYGAGVILFLDKINFGACSNVHAVSSSGAFIKTTTVNISGASSYHIYCETWGNYEWYGGSSTTTITGTPAFNQFVYCGDTGRVVVYGITFSGSATGVRYYAALNSVINTFGSGASYLPGNSAGSVATGGQYV